MSEKENKSKKYILPVSLSIVFLIVGFGFGVLFQKGRSKTTFSNRTGQFQMGGNMGDRAGNRNNTNTGTKTQNNTAQRNNNGGLTVGEITKIEDGSIILKTTDGSSKIVLISSDTTFTQSTSATKTDLKVGSKIMVTGATDSNSGSITGKTIQLNPATMPQPEQPQQ